MATVTTSIRIDEDLKKKASMICKDIGVTMNQVIEKGLREFVAKGKITFGATYEIDAGRADIVREDPFSEDNDWARKELDTLRRDPEWRKERWENVKKRRERLGDFLLPNPQAGGK